MSCRERRQAYKSNKGKRQAGGALGANTAANCDFSKAKHSNINDIVRAWPILMYIALPCHWRTDVESCPGAAV